LSSNRCVVSLNQEIYNMKRLLLLTVLVCSPSLAQTPQITPLLTKELTGIPGKEASMLTVEYPPGGSSPIHRHNAHVFVYVLEGAVVMQVKGGTEVRLTRGQTFYESPSDVHVVSRNASTTEPARFIVFSVKDIGAPIVVPAN
jgi:quercetin dioxygenase-like cupin family protein